MVLSLRLWWAVCAHPLSSYMYLFHKHFKYSLMVVTLSYKLFLQALDDKMLKK